MDGVGYICSALSRGCVRLTLKLSITDIVAVDEASTVVDVTVVEVVEMVVVDVVTTAAAIVVDVELLAWGESIVDMVDFNLNCFF